MARRPKAGSHVAAQAGSELRALVLRLESLRVELAAEGAEPETLVARLTDALADVDETWGALATVIDEFEQEMARERELYRDLFDRAPDAYIVTDASGKILDANNAAAALFGKRLAFTVGKPLPLFVLAEHRRELRGALLALAHEPRLDFELRFESPLGPRDVEVRAAAARDAESSRVLVRWILRDVTERRRAEAEVKALNADLELRIAERTRELTDTSARLETALREIPEGVVIVDRTGALVLANRRAQELLGAPSDELRQRPLGEAWSIFAPDGRPLPASEWAVARTLATGEPSLNQRVEAVRPDGMRVLIEASAVPVPGADGAVESVVVTFRDVTTRDLRERAERDFVTNAAHELQTPIAAITSAIEVLQAGAKERRGDRDRFLMHIERAADRLGRLTRALLVLARAQTRDEQPRSEMLELEPFLRSVAEGFPVDVVVECPSDIAVIANRALLEQAVTNLGENALKYSQGGVVLAGRPRNGRVAIEIRDEGPGIPPAERSRVFERFYRSDDATGDGFGLGLAIVREAVDALEADLELDSGPSGTRVSILLPGAKVRPT